MTRAEVGLAHTRAHGDFIVVVAIWVHAGWVHLKRAASFVL